MTAIDLDVDRKLLLDLASDGMDYVCRGYWAQIEQYKWYFWYVCDDNGEPDTYQISPDLTDDTVLFRLRDDGDGEAEDEDRPFVDITINKLREAFFWTLINYGHTVLPFEVSEGNTIVECNYDAITADVMLQYIVFGEVVYG
jgi:hypothetical protein